MAADCGTGKNSGAEEQDATFPIIWTVQDGEAINMLSQRERRPSKAVGLSE